MKDGEAFETYFAEELANITPLASFGVDFEGERRPLGWILYKWFRCSLMHEAVLAPEVAFVPDTHANAFSILSEAGPPARVVVSERLVILLANLVCRSRENVGLPPDVRAAFMAYVSDDVSPAASPRKRILERSRQRGREWLRLSTNYFK